MDASHFARIEAARALVAAPLLITLADNLRNNGQSRVANLVIESIKPEWKRMGEIVISDAILHPMVLHLRTSKVPKGYKFEISIPSGYEKSLREKFALFREAIRSFWCEWRASAEGPLADALREIPTTMQETETAFFWCDNDQFWVGIFGYFSDSSGKQYIVNEPISH